jgi:hypothetical protein
MYSIKTENKRAWYVAGIKCGSQTMQSIFDNQLISRVSKASKNFHATAAEHYASPAFNHFGDFLFTTIRNPYERHVSNYLYQREKFQEKIKYKDDIEAYRLRYPNSQIEDSTIYFDMVEDQLKYYFNSFESYVDILERVNTPTLYKGEIESLYRYYGTSDEGRTAFNVGSTRAFLSMSNNLISNGTLHCLKIEDHDQIIDFFYRNFNMALTMIPKINSTGYGKDYEQYYTPELIDKITRIESPIIDIGNYKY